MKYLDDKLTLIQTDDGSMSLYNQELNETYHSKHGAIQESEYVYIKQGLDFVVHNCALKKIKIFEFGFGMGYNLLVTINYLLRNNELSIEYTSVEKYPLSMDLISKLNFSMLDIDKEAESLYIDSHNAEWNKEIKLKPNLTFKKIYGDIRDIEIANDIHLVYYDAFAPKRQSEVWDISIFEKIHQKMALEGVLVTYCSQGKFQRSLKSLNMEVTTLKGPPFKNEMIRAVKKVL